MFSFGELMCIGIIVSNASHTESRALFAIILSGAGLSDFSELMRFGIIMNVTDGCEPSPEEVEAGVAGTRKKRPVSDEE